MIPVKKIFFQFIPLIVLVIVVTYLSLHISKNPGSSDSVAIQIPFDTLDQQFRKAETEKLLVEVYPIKETSENIKKDFGLVVYYRNPSDENTDAKDFNPNLDFQKKTANYVSYLKHKGVNGTDIPWGYQFTINQSQLFNRYNMAIQLNTETLNMTFSYDSCKIPPGCNKGNQNIVLRDSACKIPPGCKFIPLRTTIMKNHIKELFELTDEKKKSSYRH
jgi:hypothetical protein